jgi:PadR family transcriptional regulator PadR
MISGDVIRGHVDTIILRLITERDMYGYELANEIKTRTGNRFDIREATLYAVVQRLEERGLITSYTGEKSHGGQRRYYRITALGKAYYGESIAEWRELRGVMEAIVGEDGR